MKHIFSNSAIILVLITFFITTINCNSNSFPYEEKAETESLTLDSVESSDIQIEVSARGTFLRADPPRALEGPQVEEPTIIDLEYNGLEVKDWIKINYSGKIFYTTDRRNENLYSDWNIVLLGLFSTTKDLESTDVLNRIPGAIDFGDGYVTDQTYFSKLSTDITQDFIVTPFEGIIQIPDEAKFLFLCPADIYYPDNSGTIHVNITKLEFYQVLLSITNIILVLEVILIVTVIFAIKRQLS